MKIQDKDKSNKLDCETEGHVKIDKSRRRIARAGVIAPVIMSLSSRPAWAINCSVSGNLSGNASSPVYDDACNKPGLSAYFWFENEGEWCGTADFQPGSDFNLAFGKDVYKTSGGSTPNPTLLEVVNAGGSLNSIIKTCGGSFNYTIIQQLTKATVAAINNAFAFYNSPHIAYPYSEANVIALFQAAYESCNETDMENLIADFNGLNNPDPVY